MYDDVLDLAGEEGTAGKTLGSDLRKGKLTLPILHLLQTSSTEERHRVCETILAGEEAAIGQLLERAVQCGAIAFAVSSARRMLREAADQLRVLPASRYREALHQLVESLDGLIGRFGS